MKAPSCLLVLLAVAAAGGCTVIRNEFRTLVSEPIKYGDNVDIIRTTKWNKKLAKEAFAEFEARQSDTPPSPDCRDGFIDGFIDYLTFGGSGAPPVVPPRRYWNLSDRSPAGHSAVQDWFAGFAAGASEAMLSGLREQQTVPSSYVPAVGANDVPTLGREGYTPQGDQSLETLPEPESSQPATRAVPLQESTELPPLPPISEELHESSGASRDAESDSESLPDISEGASTLQTRLEELGTESRSTSIRLDRSLGPGKHSTTSQFHVETNPEKRKALHFQNADDRGEWQDTRAEYSVPGVKKDPPINVLRQTTLTPSSG